VIRRLASTVVLKFGTTRDSLGIFYYLELSESIGKQRTRELDAENQGPDTFLEILDSCIAFLFLLFITTIHPIKQRNFLSEVSSPLWSRLSAILVDFFAAFRHRDASNMKDFILDFISLDPSESIEQHWTWEPNYSRNSYS
jgi:hypothetical protein